MELLYIQDTHLRGKNPENRMGNYYQEVMDKIKEAIFIAKNLKINTILHGGDLYDSELVSNVMVDEFIDLVEASGIKWYILPGNHDEIGNNWTLSKSSTLAHIFRRSKLINELTIQQDGKKFAYIIQGFKYFHNLEEYIRNNGLMCKSPNTPFKIAIVHALITLKSLPYQAMHTVAKNIKTYFDVVLVAHNHSPWGIKEINGVKYVNLGCLGRRKIDEKDVKPSVLLIDTETKDLKIIELKSAKKPEEVFDLKKVEEIKLFEGELIKFIDSLSDIKWHSLNIRGKIEEIGKQKGIDKNIIKECITRIGGFEK